MKTTEIRLFFTKLQTSITPCKIRNSKKNPFNSYSALDGLFNETAHNSPMNISIGQNCLNKKKPFEYIVPPSGGVGTTSAQQIVLIKLLPILVVFVLNRCVSELRLEEIITKKWPFKYDSTSVVLFAYPGGLLSAGFCDSSIFIAFEGSLKQLL